MPPALRRMLESLTEQDKRRKFRHAWEREPEDEEELEAFIHELARGLYNDGWAEWPEDDEEVD
jgi:hypothetical protein